jgi:hypothetical protein
VYPVCSSHEIKIVVTAAQQPLALACLIWWTMPGTLTMVHIADINNFDMISLYLIFIVFIF